ncbi:MAG TPA: YraN family protein [Nitrospiraceae bacterium]|nr:YraN family protein [Nitrospiraceae bacterium]
MNVGRRAFGQTAESEAERYLRRKGYRILARNDRSSCGELDLVAQMEGTLVFIEVKARRTSAFGGAPHAVDGRKQARLVRLAAQYLARHRMRGRSCRFDVVLYRGGSAKPAEIEHIENAFEVPGEDLRW